MYVDSVWANTKLGSQWLLFARTSSNLLEMELNDTPGPLKLIFTITRTTSSGGLESHLALSNSKALYIQSK